MSDHAYWTDYFDGDDVSAALLIHALHTPDDSPARAVADFYLDLADVEDMAMRNSDLPSRAEVLRDGPALLPEWLSMHVPDHDPIMHVWLFEGPTPRGTVNIKHANFRHAMTATRDALRATDWQGMVRAAIGILSDGR